MRTANLALPTSAPSLLVSRIPLPLMVAAFCLLWASAFSVAKLAIADCPPLLLLMTRFLLAGMLMLGAAAICGAQAKLPAAGSTATDTPRKSTRMVLMIRIQDLCCPDLIHISTTFSL